jgi:hypothetical protein
VRSSRISGDKAPRLSGFHSRTSAWPQVRYKIAAVGTAFRLRRNLSKLGHLWTPLAAIGVLLIYGPRPRPLCRPETSAKACRRRLFAIRYHERPGFVGRTTFHWPSHCAVPHLRSTAAPHGRLCFLHLSDIATLQVTRQYSTLQVIPICWLTRQPCDRDGGRYNGNICRRVIYRAKARWQSFLDRGEVLRHE